MVNEIWKEVKDYEGLYEVSNLGHVKSLNYRNTKKERLLKNTLSGPGYLTVNLYLNGNSKTHYIHQLVAKTFLNHKSNGYSLIINHKNFIRTDNRIENLEIVTVRENTNKKHLKSNSQYTGVYFYNNKNKNKWRSCITIDNKKIHLGYFNTEIEAHEAYQKELLTLNK